MTYPFIDWERFSWLMKVGVPKDTLVKVVARAMLARGRSRHGLFEDDEAGQVFLIFEEPDDLIFWQPRTDKLATADGRTFALGEAVIDNPATYSFDCHLSILASPLDWLRNRCDGIVVVDWRRAFDRLRDVPRVAVAEDLLPTFRAHVRPRRMPEVSVIAHDWKVAA